MTDTIDGMLDQFLSEVRAFHSGKRKSYPQWLSDPLYVNLKKMPQAQTRSGNVVRNAFTTKEQKNYKTVLDADIAGRWNMLFMMYGINRTENSPAEQWRLLAEALAAQHVPAFRVVHEPPAPAKPKRQRGAPKKNDAYRDAFFVHAVDVARNEIASEKKKPTLAASIRRALKSGYLKILALKSANAKSTAARYHEALKRWSSRPFNKALLADGSKHTPQSLAWLFLVAIEEHEKSE